MLSLSFTSGNGSWVDILYQSTVWALTFFWATDVVLCQHDPSRPQGIKLFSTVQYTVYNFQNDSRHTVAIISDRLKDTKIVTWHITAKSVAETSFWLREANIFRIFAGQRSRCRIAACLRVVALPRVRVVASLPHVNINISPGPLSDH